MHISVIIPCCNAEKYLERLLKRLLSQSIRAEIIVVDSGSTDRTAEIAAAYPDKVKLIQISRSEFDHGTTRDMAFRRSTGELVVFMSQDALPTKNDSLEKLTGALNDKRIAAAFGRQIAYRTAPIYEKLIREFNYPPDGRIWSKRDIHKYGIKSYFFSDSFSVYLREAYESVGGFDKPVGTNEDMLMAAKLLHAGYSLAYVPEAAVYHSHRLTLKEDYYRNKKSGYVMERYRDRLTGSNADKEGLRMVSFVSKKLLRQVRPDGLIAFYFHAAARFLGNRAGKHSCKTGKPEP